MRMVFMVLLLAAAPGFAAEPTTFPSEPIRRPIKGVDDASAGIHTRSHWLPPDASA